MQGTLSQSRSKRTLGRRSVFLQLLTCAVMVDIGSVPVQSENATQMPIAIAVFDFELSDTTPASSLLHQSSSSATALQRATDAARRELSRSGRYRVITPRSAPSTSQQPAHLQDCDGCEAAMASRLGAQLSMIGVVNRATQTDYYVAIAIRDAHSGKLVNQQAANFAGGEEGWGSGVRQLLDHQVLYPNQPGRVSSSDK